MENLTIYNSSKEIQEKVKFKFDKTMSEVVSGRVGKFRRTHLPIISVSIYTGLCLFNAKARENLNLDEKFKQKLHCIIYKTKDGLLFLKFSKFGLYKLQIKNSRSYFFPSSVIKSVLNRQQLLEEYSYFYLHPTSDENVFLLQKIVESHV